jgi:hypothetical protein
VAAASITHSPRAWPGALDWGGDWLADAAGELAHLGFVLRDGSLPGTVPGPRLLVALRDRPTLEHFDPEEVTYWTAPAGVGVLASLTAESARARGLPVAQPFSWGAIRVRDRVPVANQFLSFGGTLLVDETRDGTLVAAFSSRAPILRWAGHSQGVDPFVDEVGSFFARLRVPIDFQPGAERQIAEATPQGLYAAALLFADRRLNAVARLREAEPAFDAAVNRGVFRLVHDEPMAWLEGQQLLDSLELG